MLKQKRRIPILLLTAVMLVTVLPASALTAQAEEALPEEPVVEAPTEETAALAETFEASETEEALVEETAALAEMFEASEPEEPALAAQEETPVFAEEAPAEETAALAETFEASEPEEPALTAQEETPVFAEAAQTIPTVYLMYILRPYVGRTPGYMAGPQPGAGAHYSFRSVVWKDCTNSVNGTVISNTTRFRPGRVYHMEVIVTPDEGYELAAIPAVGTPGLSASYYTVRCYNSGTTDRRLVFEFRMPAEFRDVTAAETEDTFYYMPVYWAAANNITTGWSDGTFRPWNTCNRAAIITFLYRHAILQNNGNDVITDGIYNVYAHHFSDMTDNAEFNRAIVWGYRAGIVKGWDDGTFRPWNTCNRAAIITFCYRYAIWASGGQDVLPDEVYNNPDYRFSDMTGNDEFDRAIIWAHWDRTSDGFSDGTFRPWNPCNRATAVRFVYGVDDSLNVPG